MSGKGIGWQGKNSMGQVSGGLRGKPAELTRSGSEGNTGNGREERGASQGGERRAE